MTEILRYKSHCLFYMFNHRIRYIQNSLLFPPAFYFVTTFEHDPILYQPHKGLNFLQYIYFSFFPLEVESGHAHFVKEVCRK